VAHDDRTERATPHRKKKAREEGQVARSRDLASALSLLAGIVFLGWLVAAYPAQWQGYLAQMLDSASQPALSDYRHLYSSAALLILRWCAPLMLSVWIVALGTTLAQGGITVSAKAFTPNWSRLNPATNFKNVFSVAGLSRLLKSLLPFGVILYLVFALFVREWGEMVHAAELGPRPVLALTFGLTFEVAWKAALALLLWSGFDYFLQRANFERSLRMTKEEVRQELKDSEGHPQIRIRIRKRRREMRRRWKLKDVRRATVVLTNPEHFAVALEYRPQAMPAPVVIAKGRNLLAQQIKQFALWHEIPLIEDRPLAQALYKSVEVGESIPASLYAAVAEILAFIHRAQSKMEASRGAASKVPPGR
jgi:flagellar biosynthesis protein FlhB